MASSKLLSPRERQVCELASRGKSNKQIAAELGLTVGTVKQYLFAAFEKLEVHNRIALMVNIARLEAARDRERRPHRGPGRPRSEKRKMLDERMPSPQDDVKQYHEW